MTLFNINDAEEILKKEYHIDNFTALSQELLPDFKLDKHNAAFSNDIFKSVVFLGSSSKCDLAVFEVILNPDMHNRRVQITQEMFKILRGQRINNAFVVFSNHDKQNYRISLLTSKYEFDAAGNIKKTVSNPRRFSYYLGHGTKTQTPYKYLIKNGKVNSLDDLVSRFSVEVVNKQFYGEIATSFTELVGGIRDGKKYSPQLSIHGVTDKNKYAEFAVRLIGRIVFCWFLKEKKSDAGVSLMCANCF